MNSMDNNQGNGAEQRQSAPRYFMAPRPAPLEGVAAALRRAFVPREKGDEDMFAPLLSKLDELSGPQSGPQGD